MQGTQAINRLLEAGKPQELPAAMATVVKTTGSAYRRPGARMFLTADGVRIGSISGGCLEADVAERARRIAVTGEPAYVIYDTNGADGDLFFETGCNGAIGVLIESLAEPNAAHGLRFLCDRAQKRQSGVMATVFRVTGNCQAEVGDRFFLHEDGAGETTLSDSTLRDALRAEAKIFYPAPQTATRTLALADGCVDVLLESLAPPVQLLICGAGQDAIPLAQCAAQIGWQVVASDHREAFLTQERFPAARLIETRPDNLPEKFVPDASCVAVIMTHHAGLDRAYLQMLLPSAVRYIGLLGPRRRGERLLNELREAGVTPSESQLERLYNPAGLDIGAETPEEIALAIIAEIQAVLTNRPGLFLRARGGPIHLPSEPAPTNSEGAEWKPPEAAEKGEAFQCPLSA